MTRSFLSFRILFFSTMIHARGRTRSRKINYISKVKIEFGWRGAFVFARRRSSSLSLSVIPYSRNGRNFKRKFTNEGDFPRTPPPFPTRGRRRGGYEEENRTKLFRSRFPRFIINARPETFSEFRLLFFLISSTRTRERLRRTAAAKNEIPRSRQKFTFSYIAIVIALEEVLRNELVPTAKF